MINLCKGDERRADGRTTYYIEFVFFLLIHHVLLKLLKAGGKRTPTFLRNDGPYMHEATGADGRYGRSIGMPLYSD